MMTAVDSSVLLDVLLNDQQHASKSIIALERAAAEGSLGVCDVVLAEVIPVLPKEDVQQFLRDWRLTFIPSTQDSVIVTVSACAASASAAAPELAASPSPTRGTPPSRAV